MSMSKDDLRLLLANKDKLIELIGKLQAASESKPSPNDRKQRMEMLASKMSIPQPKPLACPKAPPPSNDDASFPWPAQVQAYLREQGIEQYPAEFCMEWWLESNEAIDVSEWSGLPRSERYRMGLEGGEYYVNDHGVTHWRPTAEPSAPPTWDNDDDRVKPAVPSRERSDAEKELVAKTWRSLVPKLKRFGLRHLGSSEFLPAWLSDVRFALLEAELLKTKPVTGLEVAELPSFVTATLLCKAPVSSWSSNPWSVVFRRLARNWAEHGWKGAGTRRPTTTDRHQFQADDSQLQQTPAADHSSSGPAPSLALFFRVLKATGISSMPDGVAKANLIRVASAISSAPNAERKVQIELSGVSESTFYHHLGRIRSLAGNKVLFKG